MWYFKKLQKLPPIHTITEKHFKIKKGMFNLSTNVLKWVDKKIQKHKIKGLNLALINIKSF